MNIICRAPGRVLRVQRTGATVRLTRIISFPVALLYFYSHAHTRRYEELRTTGVFKRELSIAVRVAKHASVKRGSIYHARLFFFLSAYIHHRFRVFVVSIVQQQRKLFT